MTIGRKATSRLKFLMAFMVAFGAQECFAYGQGVLHAILIGDTVSKDIAIDMGYNLTFVALSLKKNIPSNLLDTKIISDSKFRVDTIVNSIQDLVVNPDDSVLVFYCGHGFYEPGKGTFIAPRVDNGVRPYLSAVDRAIQEKQPRFRAVIFDCCSVNPEGKLSLPVPTDRDPVDISPLFDELFFRSSGAVTMVSSSPGEYALCHIPMFNKNNDKLSYAPGSLFTSEFLSLLNQKANERFGWADFCSRVRSEVSRTFKRVAKGGVIRLGSGRTIRQDDQTVVARIDGQPA